MDYYNTEVQNGQAFQEARDDPKESSCAKTGIITPTTAAALKP
jgi:hypothetical protein